MTDFTWKLLFWIGFFLIGLGIGGILCEIADAIRNRRK